MVIDRPRHATTPAGALAFVVVLGACQGAQQPEGREAQPMPAPVVESEPARVGPPECKASHAPPPPYRGEVLGIDAFVDAVAKGVGSLRCDYPQLVEFDPESHAAGRGIAYRHHADGKQLGSPVPDPDGIWLALLVHDPTKPAGGWAQIARDLGDGRYGELEFRTFVREGEATTPVRNRVFGLVHDYDDRADAEARFPLIDRNRGEWVPIVSPDEAPRNRRCPAELSAEQAEALLLADAIPATWVEGLLEAPDSPFRERRGHAAHLPAPRSAVQSVVLRAATREALEVWLLGDDGEPNTMLADLVVPRTARLDARFPEVAQLERSPSTDDAWIGHTKSRVFDLLGAPDRVGTPGDWRPSARHVSAPPEQWHYEGRKQQFRFGPDERVSRVEAVDAPEAGLAPWGTRARPTPPSLGNPTPRRASDPSCARTLSYAASVPR